MGYFCMTKFNQMKYVLCLVFLGSLGFTAMSQTEGRIVFEEKIDIHRRIPEERAEMKEMIPQFRSSYFELFYTQEASKYKARERTEEEEIVRAGGRGDGGGHMRMRMAQPRREVYKNIAENVMVDEREFMTKMFLINGEAAPFTWKIADGQKTLLNFMCLKATYQDTVDSYVAWFTPQILISNGPAEYGGLPGMILQVDVNNGERVLTATEVVAEAVDKTVLEKPTKGKEVTQEEFREIVAEKTKEMREMHGGSGGGNMMFIRHD
jgi:GLPGLI family protein